MPIPNPWRGLRGLPSDVWIIVAATLVNRVGVMALPFLVLYLTRYLHVSAALAGFAITTYGVGSLLTGPIAGRLSDRLGPFRVMQVSLALTGVILLIIPLAHDFKVVAVLTFLWAIAAGGVRCWRAGVRAGRRARVGGRSSAPATINSRSGRP